MMSQIASMLPESQKETQEEDPHPHTPYAVGNNVVNVVAYSWLP